MSAFSPAVLVFRHPFADTRGRPASRFDFGGRIAQSEARTAWGSHALACRHDCYPSPCLRSGASVAGPGFLPRQSAADGRSGVFFRFSVGQTAIWCRETRNQTRGNRTCSRRNSSLQHFWQPVFPAAWQPRRNAVWPVPLLARPRPMFLIRTSWPVRPWARLPVPQVAALSACRPATRATEHLTAALTRSAVPCQRPSGAARRVAFSHADFRFLIRKARRSEAEGPQSVAAVRSAVQDGAVKAWRQPQRPFCQPSEHSAADVIVPPGRAVARTLPMPI